MQEILRLDQQAGSSWNQQPRCEYAHLSLLVVPSRTILLLLHLHKTHRIDRPETIFGRNQHSDWLLMSELGRLGLSFLCSLRESSYEI